ncbi:MAG: hypothetical protein N2643_00910 [Endomicrobia bacterium]|nr:hypothetical protein [Endomicrobiia bacterium]
MEKIYSRNTRRFQILCVSIIFIGGVLDLAFTQSSTKKLSVKQESLLENTSNSLSLKDISSRIEDLKKEVDTLFEQININMQDVRETSSSLIELNKKLEKINSDIIDILTKIENLSQEISNVKKENLELKETVEKKSVATVAAEKEPNELQTTGDIEFNDYKELNKKIESLKKEINETKELTKFQTASEVKDPNLRRIITSPYFVLTSFIISIFALLAAF